MKIVTDIKKVIAQRIVQMPPEKANEVLDFIEFITLKDSHRLMLQAQQEAVSKYWDDPSLDVYND